MRLFQKALAATLFAASLGCHAQVPAPGKTLSPELARRIEILIRQRTKVTPDFSITIGPREPSEIPGFDAISIIFKNGEETSPPIHFLLSADGKTVAQFNKYDISKDPKAIVSGAGRPARGGPESAPVQIVGFDDLECPFCTRMHQQLFPALTERYGDKVRIVYKDFPLSMHPWAMRAAVDTNCVAAQSTPGYWNLVDYIHGHGNELGGPEKSLDKANETLDRLANEEAARDKVNTTAVAECIKKQDQTAIKASMKIGEDLDIAATPVLFINGEKLEGAYPLVDIYRMVDAAMVAAGQTPPPPYVPPVDTTKPAAKPGN